MLTDNSFSVDSIAEHAERLLLMQQNFTAHASVFASMEPELLSWTQTCYTGFQAKRVAADHQNAQSKAATTSSLKAFSELRRVYFALRTYSRLLFANDTQSMDSYKLNMPFPGNQYAQLSLVSAFFTEHKRRTLANEPSTFPPILVDQLTAAFETADRTFQTKSSVRKEANHTRLALGAQHKTDIQNLKLLFTFASAVWKEDDIQFNDLGFARPDQMHAGKGNSTPNAPTNLRFNGATTLEWTAVQGATSYNISTSDDGEDWQSEQTTTTNSAVVRSVSTGKIFYKVRARNADGYGDYSAIFEHLFGLEVAQDVVYDTGELSWEEVEFASLYEVERAPRGTNTFVRVYTGGDTTVLDTPPSGNWTYRVRGVVGAVKGEWAVVAVVQQ